MRIFDAWRTRPTRLAVAVCLWACGEFPAAPETEAGVGGAVGDAALGDAAPDRETAVGGQGGGTSRPDARPPVDAGGSGGSTDGTPGGSTGGTSDGSTGGASGGASDGSTGGTSDGSTGGSTGGTSDGSTGGASDGSTGGISGGGADGGPEGGIPVPPECVPSVELCDGIDNDCDGATDEGEDGGALSEPCWFLCAEGDPGAPCFEDAMPGVGPCVPGRWTCQDGTFGRCEGAVWPTEDVCDGVDNDCNGVLDERLPDDGVCYDGPAGTAGQGLCRSGFRTCVEGAVSACEGQVTPAQETCNGDDDDCDGLTDEGPDGAPLQESCYDGPEGTDGLGLCRAGTRTCAEGALGECVGQVLPAVEVCNGADDDCDGSDDDLANPQPCATVAAPLRNVGRCQDGGEACGPGGVGGVVCDGEVLPAAEICNGEDDDCDGDVDEEEGGAGGVACYTGAAGTQDVGLCHAGTSACVAGRRGVCVGEVTPVDEIQCNGLDDDCNGVVDDGVDLQNDPDNCGECGHVCELANAVPECFKGRCVVTRCDDHAFDINGVEADGCELSLPGARTFWVDVSAANNGNGTPEFPFQTLTAAVAVANQDGDEIKVRPGTYPFGWTGTLHEYVRISSVVPHEAILLGGGGGGYDISLPARTELVGFTIDFNGPHNWQTAGAGAGYIDNVFQGQRCCANNSRHEPTLTASNQGGSRFVGNVINGPRMDVAAAQASCAQGPAETGFGASGIDIPTFGHATLVRRNVFQNFTGGPGGAGGANVACQTPPRAGTGGTAFGIRVQSNNHAGGPNLHDVTIEDNVFENFTGGAGGENLGRGYAGRGGAVIGIFVASGVLQTTMRGNEFRSLAGGAPGATGPQGQTFPSTVRRGPAYAVYVYETNTGTVLDPTNTLDGEPMYFFLGAVNPPPVDGCRITSRGASPTNWGKIGIVNSTGVRISNCTVSNLTGANPDSPGYVNGLFTAPPAGRVSALSVYRSTGTVLSGLTVSNITGGAGSDPRSGSAVGVAVSGSPNTTVRNSTFTNIDPGPGEGNLDLPAPDCHIPGDATAILVETADGQASNDFHSENNTITRTGAGAACPNVRPSFAGLRVIDAARARSTNDLVAQFEGTAPKCTGVSVEGTASAALVDHATALASGGCDAATSAAVRVALQADATVQNSILDGTPQSDGPASSLALLYDLVVGAAEPVDLPRADEVEGVIGGDPMFVNAASFDFHLSPNSPAIDAGDPAAACNLEPPPPAGQCRADAGYTGNTAAGLSR